MLSNQRKVNTYREISNISCTKSQNLNASYLSLQSSLRNILKPGVKSRTKIKMEQRRQATLQLHLSDQQFNCLQSASYIIDLTVDNKDLRVDVDYTSIRRASIDSMSNPRRSECLCYLSSSTRTDTWMGTELTIPLQLDSYIHIGNWIWRWAFAVSALMTDNRKCYWVQALYEVARVALWPAAVNMRWLEFPWDTMLIWIFVQSRLNIETGYRTRL